MALLFDMNDDGTNSQCTQMEPSAYIRSINYMHGEIKIKCKNISEDPNRTTFKSYIHNIETILNKNDIYKTSNSQELIENNIKQLVCSYGTTEKEARENLLDSIKSNTIMYREALAEKQEVDKMSKIFFQIMMEIDGQLS